MDFFAHQEKARRKTQWLVGYFLLGVILTVIATYAVFALVFLQLDRPHDGISPARLWNPELFLYVTSGTVAVIFIGSLLKISQLSSGGGAVATSLGGRLLESHTRDLNEQKLRNVVEEMAIAAGLPVPQIYILDDEEGINAFAAGNSPSDAAIGVTRGAIETLNRDELQGVIAHEFSHILNGDMRLNLRLMGWIFGIVCLTLLGRMLLRTARPSHRRSNRDSKGGNPLPLIGLLLIIIGGIGAFFGKLIKAAVSRQREFLADAAAAQFTRNPPGLAGALKKIAGWSAGSRLETPHAEEASHLFFGNGLTESWLQLLATHPPLEERIQRLEPGFDKAFSETTPIAPAKPSARQTPSPQRSPAATVSRETHSALAAMPTTAALAQVGNPTTAHLRYAKEMVGALPAPLTTAIREPFSATALIYALLLHEEEAPRWQQISRLQASISPSNLRETIKLFSTVNSLGKNIKLPLVELALPALRELSLAQFESFSTHVKELTAADAQVDLFEYALQKILHRHLEPQFHPTQQAPLAHYVLRDLAEDGFLLISALSHVGHDDETKILAAFSAGATHLGLPQNDWLFVALPECTLEKLDTALERLAQATPPCKKQILTACAHTVSADGVLQPAESELLRAIADAMDCPMPPLLAPESA